MLSRQRYRLYVGVAEEVALERTAAHCRVVWNWAVGRRRELWEHEGVRINYADQCRELTDLRNTDESMWLAETSAVAQQQVLRDVDQAYRNWWNKSIPAGPPKFKTKRSWNPSFRLTGSAFRLKQGRLQLAGVGWLDGVRWSRDLPSEPSSVTVCRDASGRWFVSFVVEVPDEPLEGGDPVGIDLGVGDRLWTTDHGEVEENPRHLRRKERYLTRCQRSMDRKQKGSKNRERARVKVARAHARVADARADHRHKATTALVRDHSFIAVQNDNAKAMMRGRLAKSVADAAPGMTKQMLNYKAQRHHRTLVLVDRWTPTTSMCHRCGARTKLGLGDRRWTCGPCGASHDRDVNAAKNILAAGLAERRNACGDDVRPATATAVRAVVGEAGSPGGKANSLLTATDLCPGGLLP